MPKLDIYRYRTEISHENDGVVITYNDDICGWVNELRNPEHWRPGAIAHDANGTKYIATGGNVFSGAEEWCLAGSELA